MRRRITDLILDAFFLLVALVVGSLACLTVASWLTFVFVVTQIIGIFMRRTKNGRRVWDVFKYRPFAHDRGLATDDVAVARLLNMSGFGPWGGLGKSRTNDSKKQ